VTAKAAVLGRDETKTAHFSFPIVRKEYTPSGDLVVYGPCTDGTRDADHQKVDTGWSAKALQDWYETGGNIRVQHSPFLYPAGRGLAIEPFKDGSDAHWLKALVLKATPAFDLVEKGVLRDFSIGVLDPVTLFNDPTAPAGTISGGQIGEVSLVDRGSNKNTTFTIVKAAKDGPAELVARLSGPLAPTPATVFAGKRQLKDGRVVDSSGQDRSGVADSDFAGPGKTFPIETRADVPDAASLAHHADNPDQVRSSIRAIARRKFGMKDEDMPASLKAEPCGTCHGKGTILDGHRKCPDCPGPANKGDAAGDYPGDKGEDSETVAEYNADDDKDEQDGKAEKVIDPRKLRKKLIKAQRRALLAKGAFPEGDNGGDTPVDDPHAKGKTMKPAGEHREPDGEVAEEFEKDARMDVDKAAPDGPSFALRRLHDLVCPAFTAKSVRQAYGLKAAGMFDGSLLPEREVQTLAMKAIGDLDFELAGHYAGILETLGQIQHIGPDTLLEARKAFPELFPNAHPRQQTEIRPSQFTRGYLSEGHTALNAGGGGTGGAKLPSAPVRHISASQFDRGFISSGHASPSPSGGTQASASSAAFGQALNSLSALHTRVAALAPGMCPAHVTQMDLAHSQEGSTGIRPSTRPHFPDPVGKSAPDLPAGVGGGDEPYLRRKLAKAQLKMQELKAENDRLGSLPSLDPADAPFRGIPELNGPVDRKSLVTKGLVGDENQADDQEYLDYLDAMTHSGDPRLRASAMKVLTAMVTK